MLAPARRQKPRIGGCVELVVIVSVVDVMVMVVTLVREGHTPLLHKQSYWGSQASVVDVS